MKFTDLDVTEASAELIKITFPLDYKIKGKVIPLKGEWVKCHIAESEKFRQVKTDLQRKAVTGQKFEPRQLVTLIIDEWSFEEECNEENKLKAAKIWPQKAIDYIDGEISSAANFILA